MKTWPDLSILATYSAALLATVGGTRMAPAQRFSRSFAGAENSLGSAAGAAGGGPPPQQVGEATARAAVSFAPYAALWRVDVDKTPWPGDNEPGSQHPSPALPPSRAGRRDRRRASVEAMARREGQPAASPAPQLIGFDLAAGPSSTNSRRAKRDDEVEWTNRSPHASRPLTADQSRPELRYQGGAERPDQSSQSNQVSSIRVLHFQPDPKAAREVSTLKSRFERHLADSRRQSNSVQVAMRAAEDSAETARAKADAALAKVTAVEAGNADTQRQVVVNTIAIAALRRASGVASMADHAANPGANADPLAQGTGAEVTQLKQAIKALQDRQQHLEDNLDLEGEESSIAEEDIRTIRADMRKMDDQIRQLQVHDNFRAREGSRFKRQLKTLESELAGVKSQCASRTDDAADRRDDLQEINEIVAKLRVDIEILETTDRSLSQQIDILDEAIRRVAKTATAAAPESEY